MITIQDKRNCCGCTACYSVCSNQAIKMVPDSLGFLYPMVDKKKCTNCNLCEKVCPYLNVQSVQNKRKRIIYAARLKDNEDLFLSQSGGAFWALAKHFSNIGVIYGAAWVNNEVRHIRCTTIESCKQLRGSKYVQSDINDIYINVLSDLKNGIPVLFTGTGCQVLGLLSFVPNKHKDKLYTIDLICHAIPSPTLWKENIKYLERLYNNRIIRVNTRDNRYGWTPCKATYLFKNGMEVQDNKFLEFWFKSLSVRDSCSNCLCTTLDRVSDITIGDYWGGTKKPSDWNDEKGVSLCIIHTQKGKRLFEMGKNELCLVETDEDDCTIENPQLSSSIILNPRRTSFINDVKCEKTMDYLYSKYILNQSPLFENIKRKCYYYYRIRNKIARRLHRPNIYIGGVIMLHRIDSPNSSGIWYNQHLKFSAQTLKKMVDYARKRDCRFVSLDELAEAIRKKKNVRRLIAVTFDDGYRDNFTNGVPIFKQLGIPYTIYVCTKMVKGKMLYWWEILEQLILRHDIIVLKDGQTFDCSTKEAKEQAFLDIREIILKLPQDNLIERLKELFENYEIDYNYGNDFLGLTWEQIKELKNDPLATIGNHTYSHSAFTGCTDDEIFGDIKHAADDMRANTGITMQHFAFPFGEATAVSQHDVDLIKQLGFKTSATTRDGLVCYGTDPLELPRLFVTERNWKQVIDRIISNC